MATDTLLVTPAQRDRGVEILKEMYADGRLTHFEFDQRLDKALQAKTRADLNSAFDGLVARPVPTYAPMPMPYAPPMPVRPYPSSGRGLGTLAHWSGYPFFFIGPAVMVAATSNNPPARRHAVEALNFQLTMLLVFVTLGVLAGITGGFTWFFFPFAGLAWFILTGIGGLATLAGNNFRYPFTLRMVR
jgi:uncharacterized Tic20 family protein